MKHAAARDVIMQSICIPSRYGLHGELAVWMAPSSRAASFVCVYLFLVAWKNGPAILKNGQRSLMAQ
ncbi:hypothetical protein NEOLEDRAFT_1136325 [Neolentinus lepideus HHB14362 ss-1]|uniref:Uncharacterized protein n=1 Tax=Neolentinus lepideus HHB14362 ss-1 TaxID=1314782 RepID=A0A165RAR4_9AGAM|nr:hypothetical protein NEOLEDRAFT_1136325 [Neolentinus lepideus HHB14362 ss-1]